MYVHRGRPNTAPHRRCAKHPSSLPPILYREGGSGSGAPLSIGRWWGGPGASSVIVLLRTVEDSSFLVVATLVVVEYKAE